MIELADGKAYKISEVALILKCCEGTVKNYIKAGKLKAQKIVNTNFIKAQTLKDFVERRGE